jgi:hypothetical protein
MNIVGRVRKWWIQRNAVPEPKAKLLNERIQALQPASDSRYVPPPCTAHA